MKMLLLFVSICYASYAQSDPKMESIPPRLQVSRVVIEPSSLQVPRGSVDGRIVVQVYNALVVEKIHNPTATVRLRLIPSDPTASKAEPPQIFPLLRTERVGVSPTIFTFSFSVLPSTSPGQYRVEACVSSDNDTVEIKISEDHNEYTGLLTILP